MPGAEAEAGEASPTPPAAPQTAAAGSKQHRRKGSGRRWEEGQGKQPSGLVEASGETPSVEAPSVEQLLARAPFISQAGEVTYSIDKGGQVPKAGR